MIRTLSVLALLMILVFPVFAQDTFSWDVQQLSVWSDTVAVPGNAEFVILMTNTTQQDRAYTLEFTELPQPTYEDDWYTRSWCTHGGCAPPFFASVTQNLVAGETDDECHVAFSWNMELMPDSTIYIYTRAFDQEFPDDYVETMFTMIIGEGTDVDEGNANQPLNFSLAPVYPNPFNAQATVNFTLPVPGNAQLALFDVTGRQVATLTDGYFAAGSHQVTLQANQFGSGTYFLRLVAGQQEMAQRVTLVK